MNIPQTPRASAEDRDLQVYLSQVDFENQGNPVEAGADTFPWGSQAGMDTVSQEAGDAPWSFLPILGAAQIESEHG